MSNITNTEKISVFALSFNEVKNIDFFFESISSAVKLLFINFIIPKKLIKPAENYNLKKKKKKKKKI